MVDVDLELCVKLLKILLLKNFFGICLWIENVSKKWLSEFFNFGGFDCLFDGLMLWFLENGLKFIDVFE